MELSEKCVGGSVAKAKRGKKRLACAAGGIVSLDWYSGSAAKSPSPSTQYRQLCRLGYIYLELPLPSAK